MARCATRTHAGWRGPTSPSLKQPWPPMPWPPWGRWKIGSRSYWISSFTERAPRMKINIVGGGPAGLYFAILMKLHDPAHAITVVERDGPNDTFGWGIVFSDRTYSYLRECDPVSYAAIQGASETWEDVVIGHRDTTLRVTGNPMAGISRLTFLNLLHDRCRELGIDLRFHTNVTQPEQLADWRDC